MLKAIRTSHIAENLLNRDFTGLGARKVLLTNIRPLAKLDKAVKVADASNQRKAKCKTVSAIAVALREDAKSFDKADSVFNKDTIL